MEKLKIGTFIEADNKPLYYPQIVRIRKRARKLNFLTKEQVQMLKKEYNIILTTKHSEADALKLLKGGKFIPQHNETFYIGNDSKNQLPNYKGTDERLLLKITKKGKKIYQFN